MRTQILFSTLTLFTAASAVAEPQTPLPPVRIILVGDSTMAVRSGWGPGFSSDIVSQVTLVNMAKGGRSSGSYRAEGSWTNVLNELKRNAEFKATYVLIQFGHNDQPGKPGRSTDLATEFPVNIRQYVQDVLTNGAKPVLITPLTRRWFTDGKVKNDLAPWADATKKIAAEMGVPVLDLNADSVAAVQKMGPVEANTLAMAPPPPIVAESAASGNSVPAPKTLCQHPTQPPLIPLPGCRQTMLWSAKALPLRFSTTPISERKVPRSLGAWSPMSWQRRFPISSLTSKRSRLPAPMIPR